MKDISKVLSDLDELARKWQREDTHVRTKPEGGKVCAQHAYVRQALMLNTNHSQFDSRE